MDPGACFGRMSADVREPRMNVRDPVRIGFRLSFGKQPAAFLVRSQNHLHERVFCSRSLLGYLTDTGAFRDLHRPGFDGKVSGNDLEQGRLACAVAADKACLGLSGQGNARLVDQKAIRDPVCKVRNLQHGRMFGGASPAMQAETEHGKEDNAAQSRLALS